MSVGIIFLLILALLLVIFTLQNPTTIDLHVFFWSVHDVSLVLALIICLILGVVLGFAFTYPKIWKLKSQLKENQRKRKDMEIVTTVPEQKNTPNPEGIEMTGDNDKSFFKD